MANGSPKIGLGQAQRLCQMSHSERLAFIAEGLPVVLSSAQGFWQAASRMDGSGREAAVLEQHAKEEAAKVLILMDMVRCPKHLVSSRMGSMVKWFYSHLARLIYAEALDWRPTNMADLRKYVNRGRRSHHVDGDYGEIIVPNYTTLNRELSLYADISACEVEGVSWSNPSDRWYPCPFRRCTPTVFSLAESMSRLGMFTRQGVELTAEIWGTVEFNEQECFHEANELKWKLLTELIDQELPTDGAKQEDVNLLLRSWQLPMYHLDFELIKVSLEDLQNEQEAIFWGQVGPDYL